MAIAPIGATAFVPPVAPLPGTTGAAAATTESGGGFADAISRAVDTVSASHARADELAVQAATGDLNAVHDFTIAATEAQLLTQLTVEVRNRAIEAFNDIMRMQV
jgi:flagellar hook-basal body complex protein FliE